MNGSLTEWEGLVLGLAVGLTLPGIPDKRGLVTSWSSIQKLLHSREPSDYSRIHSTNLLIFLSSTHMKLKNTASPTLETGLSSVLSHITC